MPPEPAPETIEDEDFLHRRLHPFAVRRDGTVSSSAFEANGRPDNQISVDLARMTTPERTLRDRPDFGIGQLVARDPRAIGFEVVHDPLAANDAHSLIRGENSKARCRQIAEKTIVLFLPHPRSPESQTC